MAGWRVVGASVRGVSHIKSGQSCQDAHHWQVTPSGVLIGAVADGAGSAPLAEFGADAAVAGAVEAVWQAVQNGMLPETDEDWRDLLAEGLRGALSGVERAAEARSASTRDLASTLILMIATPTTVAVAQIGDGAAVVGDTEGTLHALTVPQGGEYVNETTFLIDTVALEAAEFVIWRHPATCIAAFSDGLQRLALRLPMGTPHTPFFAPLFRFVATAEAGSEARDQLAQFLMSPRLAERTDDDLTLLLASRDERE